MYEKTCAIVLRLVKHTDKMSILHLYTREFGRIACSVHGVHGRKSNNKAALFEPLTILEVDILQRNTNFRLSESKLWHPLRQIPFDMAKRSIVMLLAEVLDNVLRESFENTELFDFVLQSIVELDETEHVANFHLYFLLQLTIHLGFQPNMEGDGTLFDLESGELCNVLPFHPNYIVGEELHIFQTLFTDYNIRLSMTQIQRRSMLNVILNYYRLHVPEFRSMKSIDVLVDILNG